MTPKNAVGLQNLAKSTVYKDIYKKSPAPFVELNLDIINIRVQGRWKNQGASSNIKETLVQRMDIIHKKITRPFPCCPRHKDRTVLEDNFTHDVIRVTSYKKERKNLGFIPEKNPLLDWQRWWQ
jgi:hypothetical protein